jgi:hypothetical protein
VGVLSCGLIEEIEMSEEESYAMRLLADHIAATEVLHDKMCRANLHHFNQTANAIYEHPVAGVALDDARYRLTPTDA